MAGSEGCSAGARSPLVTVPPGARRQHSNRPPSARGRVGQRRLHFARRDAARSLAGRWRRRGDRDVAVCVTPTVLPCAASVPPSRVCAARHRTWDPASRLVGGADAARRGREDARGAGSGPEGGRRERGWLGSCSSSHQLYGIYCCCVRGVRSDGANGGDDEDDEGGGAGRARVAFCVVESAARPRALVRSATRHGARSGGREERASGEKRSYLPAHRQSRTGVLVAHCDDSYMKVTYSPRHGRFFCNSFFPWGNLWGELRNRAQLNYTKACSA